MWKVRSASSVCLVSTHFRKTEELWDGKVSRPPNVEHNHLQSERRTQGKHDVCLPFALFKGFISKYIANNGSSLNFEMFLSQNKKTAEMYLGLFYVKLSFPFPVVTCFPDIPSAYAD